MLRFPVTKRCALVVMATTHGLIDRVFLWPIGFLRKGSKVILFDDVSKGRFIEYAGDHGIWTLFALLIVLYIAFVDAFLELGHGSLFREQFFMLDLLIQDLLVAHLTVFLELGHVFLYLFPDLCPLDIGHILCMLWHIITINFLV